MDILRTPDARFADLPGFPFVPYFVDIDGLRMHYIDEGKGDPILCLHGEPSWSYLYRKMIPPLSQAGRVVAPDLIGFGRSDKLPRPQDYNYSLHASTLRAFVERLDLKRITLIVQDWGGMLGLPLATQASDRFARLVILNTALPSGRGNLNLPFRVWRLFVRLVPTLPVGLILQVGTVSRLPPAVLRAYQAPFHNRASLAGAKAFPALVPSRPDAPGAAEMRAAQRALRRWEKPALVMFSDNDPVLGGGARLFRRLIPTASEQPEITIRNAGHFLPEDKGEEIAGHVLRFLED